MTCSAADNYCAENVESIYDTVLNRDEYDIRELLPDPLVIIFSSIDVYQLLVNETPDTCLIRFPPEFYVAYLNSPVVQSAIGAFQNFTEYSAAVGDAFNTTGDDGREDGTVEDMLQLLEQGVTVCLRTLHIAGAKSYSQSSRCILETLIITVRLTK